MPGRKALIAATENDVVVDIKMGEKGVVLVDEADSAPLRRQPGNLAASKQNPARGQRQQAGNGLKDQGFTGPGRPHEHKKITVRNRQRDFFKGKVP